MPTTTLFHIVVNGGEILGTQAEYALNHLLRISLWIPVSMTHREDCISLDD